MPYISIPSIYQFSNVFLSIVVMVCDEWCRYLITVTKCYKLHVFFIKLYEIGYLRYFKDSQLWICSLIYIYACKRIWISVCICVCVCVCTETIWTFIDYLGKWNNAAFLEGEFVKPNLISKRQYSVCCLSFQLSTREELNNEKTKQNKNRCIGDKPITMKKNESLNS